jgi:epoxyqueuosine reductase
MHQQIDGDGGESGDSGDSGESSDRGFGGRDTAGLPDLGTLRQWALGLGFSAAGVASVDLSDAEPGLAAWLQAGFHGSMDYMARYGMRRARPAELVPGTVSALMVRIDYAPPEPDWIERAWTQLADGQRAYVSRYALGRDYHKVVRGRLQKLADRIAAAIGPFGYRVFCDSGPVMEVELARRADLGWRGKHTLLIDTQSGSTFFLGTLLTDLPLCEPSSASGLAHSAGALMPDGAHCGRCERCLQACPTQAIVAPYRLDARRCIAYLTIESGDPIPVELRKAVGNRIYGCDDCQLACPWNGFAQASRVADLQARALFGSLTLEQALSWDRASFERHTEGMAIRRIGHERWLRNVAVALGNAPPSSQAMAALEARRDDPSPLVREHVGWAIEQQQGRMGAGKAG